MQNQNININNDKIRKPLVDRFMSYVRIDTQSDRHVEETPSTPGQWELAKVLKTELLALGLEAELTDHCYVIGRLPASKGRENAPTIGFLAHMDTASDVSGKNVKPQLVENYNGAKISLSEGLFLDPESDSGLAAHKGKPIIHTDGSTLLGADNKAGVAAIMSAVEFLAANPEIRHGQVEVIFTPDEETGKGLPEFPLKSIKSEACYTLDGGPAGEIETECFNASRAEIKFKGKVIHIGAARGILANAAMMAAAYASLLPRSESPEATDGYYGYYCATEINGTLENASLEVYLRDFDGEGMKRRIQSLEIFAKAIEAQFPGGKVEVDAHTQYLNMKEKIDKKPDVLAKLRRAMDNLGIEGSLKPIRGGTDGSRLTELGIPTPNIFTGGRNFHSRLEWVSVEELCAACRLVIELIRLWGE